MRKKAAAIPRTVTIWARVASTALLTKAVIPSVAVPVMPVAVVVMPSVTVWADIPAVAVCPTMTI